MMTELLEQAIEAVRTMPPAAQDDIARLMLRLVRDDDAMSRVTLSPAERAAIATSITAAAHDEFADDATVHAVWAKHGL